MKSANPQVPSMQVASLILKCEETFGDHHTFEETHSHENQTPKQTEKIMGRGGGELNKTKAESRRKFQNYEQCH